ncbi:MAG: serine/threonine-protein kinase [Candidatus Competibacteraceae bacterium]
MEDSETVLIPGRTEADFTLSPGVLVLNTYCVERLLNKGGMGEVYLARHTALGTRHAIKVIKPELLTNPMVIHLSQREAMVLRDVHNDAIVGYEGFLQDDAGHWYLCMEYVEGHSLAERLKRGPLPVEQVYRLRDRLITGLAAAHARGVVHRDISPDNVILPEDRVENAKLIDFGIAKLTLAGTGTILANTFVGKLRYTSPEQLGLFNGVVDARSDIYSLGLVLAAVARGRPLPMGDSYETACQARRRVPDLRGIPTELHPQLKVLLQPDPRNRPDRITEILQRWPTPGSEPEQSHGNRPNRLIRLGATLVLLLGSGLYWWLGAPGFKTVSLSSIEGTAPSVNKQPGTPETNPPPDKQGSNNNDMPDLAAIAALPVEEIHAQADKFYQAGRLQEALGLWEKAAPRYGPAALQLGMLYDPVLWGRIQSPFSKPNPTRAEKWYQQAQQLGVETAASRLQALQNWRLTHREEP